MISPKRQKIKLNVEKTGKTTLPANSPPLPIDDVSILDKFMNKNGLLSKYSMFNESNEEINAVASKIFNQMGIVVSDINQPDSVNQYNILKRVGIYLKRFPEVEYLIDMISSSVIYSSSSNTKKIQFILNGEYKVLNKTKTTTPLDTTADSTGATTSTSGPEIDISDVKIQTEMQQVDSQYNDLNLDVGNLFKRNNVKLSLYGLVTSMMKYGYGLFYVDDPKSQTDVAFYGIDEVEFKVKTTDKSASSVFNTFTDEPEDQAGYGKGFFQSIDDNDEIKKLNYPTKVEIIVKEEGKILNSSNLYFIGEKGAKGKSVVVKVIHYLKIIELLELSLLIERLSKAKTTHVWKLDLSKIEEDDVAATMLLYRNILKNQMSMNYDENTNDMSMDIVKNLVDNNMLVPMEGDNLKIETLKSDFKPLIDDINYYWDKIYQSMGIPLHYRKGADSRAYMNNNMLIMHDNVYAMKIRHYQLIINNILTFWIENWLAANHKKLTVKFININIPEFIPISERKETDLDKAAKFINVFTQLEQMLNIKIKQDFILNTLFPNDIISDIIDVKTQEEIEKIEEEEAAAVEAENAPETEDDILSLFESGNRRLAKSPNATKEYIKLFTVQNFRHFNVVNYKLKLNIDW